MSNTETSAMLIAAIADLREETTLALVRQRLEANDDPLLIIEDCKEGMRQVGVRYERNEYFLAGLIMAGEIFRQVMKLLQPAMKRRVSGQGSGRILLGTVEGDIHDLGKNIVNMLLSCHRLRVPRAHRRRRSAQRESVPLRGADYWTIDAVAGAELYRCPITGVG